MRRKKTTSGFKPEVVVFILYIYISESRPELTDLAENIYLRLFKLFV